MKQFVGIDMSKSSHCIYIMNESGDKINQLKIKNDLEGFNQLKNLLNDSYEIHIGMECGNGLLFEFLSQFHFKIYSINPKIISRFKETFWVSKSKNDWRDAEGIANYLRLYSYRIRPFTVDSSNVALLRNYCGVYNRLLDTQNNLINRLISVLGNYLPLYLDLFSSHCIPILWKMIIQYPTLKQLKQAKTVDMKQFLHQNFYRNKKYVEKLLEIIKSYQCYTKSETEMALSFEAVLLAENLLQLSEKIKEIISLMNSILITHNLGNIFLSIPGAGVVIASHLLALFGDNYDRFRHYNDAQSYFGTAPYLYQSGNYCKVMMRKACNKMGKRVFYQLAFCSLTQCDWARKHYDALRKRGKINSVALRALSNKWVKIAFSMWKNQKLYDPLLWDIDHNNSADKIA